MDSIKLNITIQNGEEQEIKNIEISYDNAVEIATLINNKEMDNVINKFKNLKDINGVAHNIDFTKVMQFEFIK